MQAVITAEQARKITGGRKPLVPVVYEEAIKALAECLSLDDAKLWSDKADALAAWAKIYHDDKVDRQARALKLHAYRRMGQLAIELSPQKRKGGAGNNGTSSIRAYGSQKMLMANGLNHAKATAATKLANMPQGKFDGLLKEKKPVSPTSVLTLRSENRWVSFSYPVWAGFLARCRNNDPREIATHVHTRDRESIRKSAIEMRDWLDEFERHLK